MNALTAYSRDYLPAAITDELDGCLDDEHIKMAIQLKNPPPVSTSETEAVWERLPLMAVIVSG
jgi:hypothetical protein